MPIAIHARWLTITVGVAHPSEHRLGPPASFAPRSLSPV
jgi:hypothetical protein